MTKHQRQFTANDDDPANLPPVRIITAAQLTMKPGQKLSEKAKELGVTLLTLRIWTAEWRGSGFDPDYVIRRAGHDNWLKNKWAAKDWTEALRQQVAKRQHRHVGDLCLELGLTAANAQVWSQKHAEFEKLLWAEPHPKNHWREVLGYVRHAVIDDYRTRKADHIANGMDETEAMHQAADEAVNELKHKTGRRRRVERDILMGVGGHEEVLKRYRKGAKLTDAHSRRIARRLFQVSRWTTMERGLREVGYDEDDIKEKMSELMGAFGTSAEKGQAQWKKTRGAVLRRRAEADAFAKAQEVEAKALKLLPGLRASKYVKKWIEQKYEKPGIVPR
jgi:hypothetical protein